MPEQLLWSLAEAGRQLGGVSARTVRRMVERGELPSVRVGRLVRVPAGAVQQWVETRMAHAHNGRCAGRDVQGAVSYTHLTLPTN